MFKSARLKLTIWYLLIVTLISVFFSALIYFGTVRELERGFRWGEARLKAKELNLSLPRYFSGRFEDLPPRLREGKPRFLLEEDLQSAKKRLFFRLLALNGFILFFSAGLSWFWAGKTLRPIEQALEEEKRFVADASHELRTPLTALKTSMEVALRDKKITAGKAKEIIKENLEEVESLVSLSNKLLSLARYQRNGKNFVFGKLEIKELVDEAVKKISSLAKEKRIEIKVDVEKQIFWGEKESLLEMLLAFLDNAVKYTPSGGQVLISSRVIKKWLEIGIKDTGRGIAKEDLPHIFERFYRTDYSRTKEETGGFGLGLPLAKEIIEIHKGTVKAESVLGKGTTFTIRLPLAH